MVRRTDRGTDGGTDGYTRRGTGGCRPLRICFLVALRAAVRLTCALLYMCSVLRLTHTDTLHTRTRDRTPIHVKACCLKTYTTNGGRIQI